MFDIKTWNAVSAAVHSCVCRSIMPNIKNWDWETKEKCITDINEWISKFFQVHELVVSNDGEKIAAPVKTEDEEMAVCVNGETWEETFEKVWSVKFSPDDRLTALVCADDEWTLAIDGTPWENKFEYVWDTTFSADGKSIAIKARSEGKYKVVINDQPWENDFLEMRDMVISPDGRNTAAAVQIEAMPEGDIFKFEEGIWTVAVNGKPWPKKFQNVWGLDFSSDSAHVAAEVRFDPEHNTCLLYTSPSPRD